MVHLSRIFQLILHSGYCKWLLFNYKLFAFIQRFFLLVNTILEIKCWPIFKDGHYSCLLKHFSWIFADIPASESRFFQLVEPEFLSNPSSKLAYMDFGLISNRVLLFIAFFLLLESSTETSYEPVFFNFFGF